MPLVSIDPDWAVRTVAACQKGDKAAWDEMGRVLLPVLTQLARRLKNKSWLADQDDSVADDVAMQTFLALYQKIDSITDATGLIIWLRRVALNNLNDMAKKFEMRVRVTEEMWLFDKPAPIEEDEDYHALYAALRSLDEPTRELLHERFWLSLPVKEMAEKRGVPVTTVKARLVRAYRGLRVKDWS